MITDPHETPPPVNARRRLLKIFALVVLAFLVFLMWAADSGNLPNYAGFLYDFRYGDKVGHFVLYGIVAFFLSIAFPRTFKVWRFQIPYVALFFLLFALGEEWSQMLFPRRSPDIIDGVCTALGILVGTWIARRSIF
jgi:polysaccharide biosynthesis protein VpsQ